MDLNENSIHIWRPLDIFKHVDGEPDKEILQKQSALIILNQPITKENETKFMHLWKNSIVRICVDGAANRLYEWYHQNINGLKADQYIPDYICGDLDSIEESTRLFYVNRGTVCVRLKNQDLTDFSKALKFAVNCIKNGQLDQDLIDTDESEINVNDCHVITPQFLSQQKNHNIQEIYCFCDFGGRLDHAISNLNSLYDSCLTNMKTFIVSSESITFLLQKGTNIIYVDNDLVCGKYCGFFPLGMSSIVSTKGFKWNVSKQVMSFGAFISSSNEFFDNSDNQDNNVDSLYSNYDKSKRHGVIENDQAILFTMSIL